MEEKTKDKTTMQELTADFVVIGGGGAGLAAALTAVESGMKSVIVLEKRFVVGGNSSMAGGFLFGADTRIQKEAGISGFGRDEVFRETLAFHHYDRVNPRIIRNFIDKSGDTIQWLEDHGMFYKWGGNVHIMRDTDRPVGGFDKVIKTMAKDIRDGGGQILVNTSAKKILRGPEGRITGVLAEKKEGEELQINTKSVMLASGGFTGNQELLNKYFPDYYYDGYGTDAVPNMGDGIQLAAEAGAFLEKYCTLIRETGFSFKSGAKMPNRAFMENGTVWVNKNGQRFADETLSHNNACTNAVLAQPGKYGFALFDDALVQYHIDNPVVIGPDIKIPDMPDRREIFKSESEKGEWIKIADTWEELAAWIGADPEVLKGSIEEYNSFCDKGHDDLFAKDPKALIALRKPPFYALKFRPLMIDTAGPVRVNEHMEVMDRYEQPIPGFYAGGVITSGNWGNDYHLFGSALSYSINSGRIAGESAVKYLALAS